MLPALIATVNYLIIIDKAYQITGADPKTWSELLTDPTNEGNSRWMLSEDTEIYAINYGVFGLAYSFTVISLLYNLVIFCVAIPTLCGQSAECSDDDRTLRKQVCAPC